MHRMRATCLTALLLASFLTSLLPRPAYAQSGDWEALAPGIDYRVYQPSELPSNWTEDPIHVTRMDRSNPNVTLDTTIAGGYIQVGTSGINLWTGAGMDKHVDYWDGALNAWGDLGSGGQPYWGTTGTIVTAINGSYWDTSTFIPSQGQFQSGWYNWKYVDDESWSGLVYKMNKDIFIGSCVKQPADEQKVLLDYLNPNPDNEVKIAGINVPRADQSIYLYTPQYDIIADQTRPPEYDYTVEALVQLPKPLTAIPSGETEFITGSVITGTIVDIRTNAPQDVFTHTYGTPPANIGFDQVILSGYGQGASKLFQKAKIDDIVGINLRINDGVPGDCFTPTGNSWTETYAALGGGQTIVNNGEPVNIGAGVAPRTAIGYNASYIYFVVAEGHPIFNNQGNYIDRTGISMFDLGKFMDQLLGVDYAMNLDGGGSSAMVVDGSSVTHSTDLLYCPQAYIPSVLKPAAGVHQSAPPTTAEEEPFSTPYRYRSSWNPYNGSRLPAPADPLEVQEEAVDYAFGQSCHRRVPNGIAMVVVNPMQQSQAYTVPDLVAAVTATFIRQGPGLNYASFGPLPLGTITQIADPGSSLNGVYATGAYWWYIQFNGTQGWVDGRALVPYEIYRARFLPEGR